MGCHGASSGPPSGPSMWLDPPQSWTPPPAPATPPPPPVGVNVSEYGEWRWSPMGLAGRDPVFFSQLESELAYIAGIPAKEIAGVANQIDALFIPETAEGMESVNAALIASGGKTQILGTGIWNEARVMKLPVAAS